MEKRHSIKIKITILTAIIITGIIFLILILNDRFSENYYQKNKQNTMTEAYTQIDAIVNKYESGSITEAQFKNLIKQTAHDGLSIVIVNSGWQAIYSSNRDTEELIDRLKSAILNNQNLIDGLGKELGKTPDGKTNNTILEERDNYTLQKSFDFKMNDYYLEIWGNLTSGDFVLMRLPFQSITESVKITNSFIQYVGIGMILVSIVIAYAFSSYITKPIKEISHISEKMSELDFDVKYTGNDKGEIGLLGKNMNNMSEKLQQNISQLKAANIELKKDIENKIQIDEMRTDFLSNVSHELKTPISLIQGYAEGLKEGISDDPESMEFYCDVIIDEANKMNNMVKKLLTLNQIEFGNEELVMERFDIVDLITSIIEANNVRFSQKSITVTFNEKEPIYVWCDEYKIEEVITNYISNAINHCKYDNRIEVSLVKRSGVVRVSVFNTGDNIPKEDIDNIWIKFYKVDKARTREYGGNGIGLSIVKAILESYDKEFGVINHENGVEFWFELDCN